MLGGSERIDGVLKEAATQLALGIFKVQAPQLQLSKLTGGCHMPFQCFRNARLAEVFLSACPGIVFGHCRVDARLTKTFVDLNSLWSSADCVTISMERNCIGNVRCFAKWKKQVMAIPLTMFCGICRDQQLCIGAKQID